MSSRVAGLAAAALLGGAPAAALAAEPAPAASWFTTGNYALTVSVPGGLFHCPYPAQQAGSDHGIDIYLLKPKACDSQSPVAEETEAGELPQVQLFYSYNAADRELPGFVAGPPRTNQELLLQQCTGPDAAVAAEGAFV